MRLATGSLYGALSSSIYQNSLLLYGEFVVSFTVPGGTRSSVDIARKSSNDYVDFS